MAAHPVNLVPSTHVHTPWHCDSCTAPVARSPVAAAADLRRAIPAGNGSMRLSEASMPCSLKNVNRCVDEISVDARRSSRTLPNQTPTSIHPSACIAGSWLWAARAAASTRRRARRRASAANWAVAPPPGGWAAASGTVAATAVAAAATPVATAAAIAAAAVATAAAATTAARVAAVPCKMPDFATVEARHVAAAAATATATASAWATGAGDLHTPALEAV
mmetsp:Transcript_13530/g.39178  ORF Transcript_13530/g.39178 Transcript_13530/m.39178 type:complete len:221 (+) Transcript_13530:1847-2509(+)